MNTSLVRRTSCRIEPHRDGRNEPRKALVLIKIIRYVEKYPKWEVANRD